ncbi:hypothetical protein SDC9_106778 [bioreactor metagenome]|uniref:Phage tail tape measure protein n=2 Tax=root TaxID=1 RepID=A0AB33HQL1_9CHLR|nr:hypothetical protein [Dehalococcoides mccartyi]BAZ96875.1 Phage tail tape measure protein [Dehalococcoides mccartyi]
MKQQNFIALIISIVGVIFILAIINDFMNRNPWTWWVLLILFIVAAIILFYKTVEKVKEFWRDFRNRR